LLLKEGYTVEIWAKEVPPHTTSDVAAALWYPYLCNPREKAISWSKDTHDYLKEHALGDPRSGCIMRSFIELFEEPVGEPWWGAAVDAYRRPLPKELPEGYVDGYQTDVVLMDSEVYMRWLVTLFEELGGQLSIREVSDISEAFDHNPIVINCTGLGSRDLFDDERVYPVRGQIVRARVNSFEDILVSETAAGLSLIAPRIDDVVLGGTSQAHNWNLEEDPADTAEILRKVAALSSSFAEVDILDVKVGLRPARDEVRLEAVQWEGGIVFHNYGHGGAGYTLSWGCAQDVVKLVNGVKAASHSTSQSL
jgi:D-amino-acid oxidase